MTSAQAKALADAATLAEGLAERARVLIAEGVAPIEAVDRVMRDASPMEVVARAYVSVLAAADPSLRWSAPQGGPSTRPV